MENKADFAASDLGEFFFLEGGYVFPVDKDLAGGGIVQPAQHVKQGGLAAARFADDGDKLALPDFQIDVINGFDLIVARAVIFA